MRSSKLRQRNIQNKSMGEKIYCSVLEVTRRTAFRLWIYLWVEWKPRAHGSPWRSPMAQSHMSKILHVEAPNQKKVRRLFCP